MKPIDLLYFEDLSPFHEAVFAFPIIGRLSMRQMLIIGFSATASWAIYQGTANPLAMAILCLGSYVGLKKFNVMPIESQLVSIVRLWLFSNTKSKTKTVPKSTKPASKKLRVSEPFHPRLQVIGKEIRTREVFADPLKPIRLQVKLETLDKRPISNTQTRVELDRNVISTLATNDNGEIEVLIVPQTVGEKKVAIYAEGFMQPVFEEILSIKNI